MTGPNAEDGYGDLPWEPLPEPDPDDEGVGDEDGE